MVTDFHSHILPGIDDGSANLKESISMLQMAAEQGISRIVATPHFYAQHDNPSRFLKRRAEALEILQAELWRYANLPQVRVGAEVYYFRGISESDAIGDLMIGQGKYLLVEMPHAPWNEDMYRELEALYVRRGITPIIAHIDRYIMPLRTFGIPGRLAELPVLVQANGEFFTSRATGRMAMRMLREEQIHLLGSDCHNLTSRKPNLGEALELITRKLGSAPLERIKDFERLVFPE